MHFRPWSGDEAVGALLPDVAEILTFAPRETRRSRPFERQELRTSCDRRLPSIRRRSSRRFAEPRGAERRFRPCDGCERLASSRLECWKSRCARSDRLARFRRKVICMPDRGASCSCGQLRLTVRGDPVLVSVCHCLECQRRTGSAFGVQAFYPQEQVEPAKGVVKRYTRQGDSGRTVTFNFCPECGGTVFWVAAQRPELTAIAVGTFADPDFSDAPSLGLGKKTAPLDKRHSPGRKLSIRIEQRSELQRVPRATQRR